MRFSEQSKAAVISCMEEAMDKYRRGTEMNQAVTDIYLQPRQDVGELVICNDEDEELARTIVADWVDCEEDDFDVETERILRNILNGMKSTGGFDKLNIMKPYSFVLVDEEKESVAELLVMDDEDTLVINDGLMEGLDEDLDKFLEDLLKE